MMLEYNTCKTTGKKYHYTEFDFAGCGWLAIDGSTRHPHSKEGKQENTSLSNGLRVNVSGRLVGIANKKHPHNNIYKKYSKYIREKNNFRMHWLRADLTREVYINCYGELNIDLPDLGSLKTKSLGRKSSCEDSVMNFFGVSKEDRQKRVGKYYPDGIKGNMIYEYYGDYYHANPEIYKPTDKLFGKPVSVKWNHDKKRIKSFVDAGYNITIIWEKDWKNFQNGVITKQEFLSLVTT